MILQPPSDPTRLQFPAGFFTASCERCLWIEAVSIHQQNGPFASLQEET